MAFTLSGTVYSDRGVTPDLTGLTINVSVNGAASSASTTSSLVDGTYSVSVTSVNGDVLTIYLQGNVPVGVRVTISDGNNLSGADIYEDHLIIAAGNGGATPTGTNMNTSDNNGATGITAIYSSITNTSTATAAGKHVLFPAGTTKPVSISQLSCRGDCICKGPAAGGAAFIATSGTQFIEQSGGGNFVNFNITGSGCTVKPTTDLTFSGGSGSNISVSTGAIFDANGKNMIGTLSIAAAGGDLYLGSGTHSFLGVSASGGTVHGDTCNLTLTGTTTCVSIQGGTFIAPSGIFNVQGGFILTSGTFTPGTNTVNLTGTNQTFSGGNFTFYNLVKTVTAAATLTFTDGTVTTVTHNLTLQGSPSQLLTLQGSAAAGWTIAVPGQQNLNYLSVSFSTATGNTAFAGPTSTNGGSNTNWSFASVGHGVFSQLNLLGVGA